MEKLKLDKAKLLGQLLGYDDITLNIKLDKRLDSNKEEIKDKRDWSTIGIKEGQTFFSIKVVDNFVTRFYIDKVDDKKDVDRVEIINYKINNFDFIVKDEKLEIFNSSLHRVTTVFLSEDYKVISKDEILVPTDVGILGTYNCGSEFSFSNIDKISDLVFRKDSAKLKVKYRD